MNLEEAGSTARLFKLLGNHTRIRVLETLSKGDATLRELSKLLDKGKPSLCMNLGDLRRGGLVTKRGSGAATTYSLKACEVLKVLSFSCRLCKSLDPAVN